MKLTRKLNFNPAVVSIVPLINVSFLVVLFFALSSRFVLQPGLAVRLPVSTYTLAPQENAQIISLTGAPLSSIYFHDERVSLEELGRRLAAAPARGRTLILKADRATPYEFVVEVMNLGLGHGYSLVLATDAERP